ncbi:uncharacterized protein PG998_011030 [Apiospora kogelbergensis]|uniref:uncharacterized protein n=1 Tax=Apiospora kogelbergensis TaxID=1337665 RepID=UPI00312EE69C
MSTESHFTTFFFEPKPEKPIGYSTFGLSPPRSSVESFHEQAIKMQKGYDSQELSGNGFMAFSVGQSVSPPCQRYCGPGVTVPPYTLPMTEPFPHYEEHGYQKPTARMCDSSPHGLNPTATEFISPTHASGTLTKVTTPVNAGKHMTTPLKLTPVVQPPILSTNTGSKVSLMDTQSEILRTEPQHGENRKPSSPAKVAHGRKGNNKGSKERGKKEEQSETRNFSSSNMSQKPTADSATLADKKGHTEEQISPTKKTHGAWHKNKMNKKAKNQISQGSLSTEADGRQHGRKEPGNKAQPKTSQQQQSRGNKNTTQSHEVAQSFPSPTPAKKVLPSTQKVHESSNAVKEGQTVPRNPEATRLSSGGKPANPTDEKVDKQHSDNSQTQSQDQVGRKDTPVKGANSKGKSATKEVDVPLQPVVPGATWVETEPKKSTKKKGTKRYASKAQTLAKSGNSSTTSTPTLSQGFDVKGEQAEEPQASKREDGYDNQSKGNQKGGTAVEATKLKFTANQENEGGESTFKEPAITSQARKWKGKSQKASVLNLPSSQTVTSQDKKQAAPSAVTATTPNAKLGAERRDTMSSLSRADVTSTLGDSEKTTLPSSGTKTPTLRDAPAPSGSPWRKDSKTKSSGNKNEESTDAVPKVLGSGEERESG